MNENIIPRTFRDRVSRQGCYIYLGGAIEPKIRLAPSSIIETLKCERRLPSVFLIGVKKSGTTTLAKYLDLHKQIVLANEVRIPYNESTMEGTVHRYYLMMPLATPRQVVVANYPGYYWLNRVWLFRTLPYLPDVPKILVILRNPAERAISDYRHMELTGKGLTKEKKAHLFQGDVIKSNFEETVLLPNGSINTSLAFIQKGLYVTHLSEFARLIPKEHILILNGNEFAKDPLPILRKAESFLSLETFYQDNHFIYDKKKKFYCAKVSFRPDLTCMGSYKGRKHPTVSREVLKKLEAFYQPYNRRLKDEFGLSSADFEWIY
ncbi:Heparan sulfate glucosamine 3-O-sulfotransferase 3B1 [Holothuria leucospilota]|uniref:Heparan sulfate glucosamine 3-O-sulfotransferase 3B1 n=1 Tax=Holothuria leucospilota TaxID=206669 RepID=A0A9Q1HIH4_HOLLE|nr:Heparan sulfate glucosamine 3-O-sulfotransferase 3B1 [Holothuria leucospilota]